MADTTSTKVIQYVADVNDVLRKLSVINSANKRVAGALSTDFNQSFTKVGDGLGKVSAKFKLDPVTKQFDKTGESVQTFNSIIKESDGTLKKVSQTYQTTAKGSKLLSTSITDLSASQAKSAGLINPLIGKSSQLRTNFAKLSDVNQKFSKELTGVGKASFIVQSGLTSASGNTQKFSTIVATAKGQILKLNETVTKTPDGLQKVSRSVNDLTSQYNKQRKPLSNLTKNTVSLTENISRLAKRAALTIPLWLVLRGAVTGVISTFKNGLKDISDFDKSLQK